MEYFNAQQKKIDHGSKGAKLLQKKVRVHVSSLLARNDDGVENAC